MEPDENLVFSSSRVIARSNGEREITPYSRVEVVFEPKGQSTFIRLIHSAVSSDDARKGVGQGWVGALTVMTEMFGDPG